MKTPPRKIFPSEPGTWQELERHVAQAFREMGCRVAVQQQLDLPRGSVSVDVAVRDTTTAPHSFYICECKHWEKKVSQSEIHAFRTVVLEAGANRGLLIAKCGFQPGAIKASEFTNIDLLTWDEFENLLFDRWLSGVVAAVRPVLTYASVLISSSDDELWNRIGCTEDSWRTLEHLTSKHQLVLLWKLFDMSDKGREHNWIAKSIVDLAPPCAIDGLPIDTFRRLADQAILSGLRAVSELEAFWRIDD